MKLPKNNRKLTEIFKQAETPKISEFRGKYFVDMLTGFPTLKKFSHRKIFYPESNKVFGHNVILANKIWGHFFLEEGICEKIDSLKVVVINYKREKNFFISRGIRDYVRRIEDDLFLGRFNYLLMGKPRFLGYFTLSKTK